VWFLFQSLIIFAVMASNIRWHWTPNGYLAVLIGAGLAYGLTCLISTLGAARAIKRTSYSR
jgi:mannitol-specific phosphotransferase system IIBC component